MATKDILERTAKWDILRDAFLHRTPCPSYKELGEEFGVPHSSVSAMGREENWPKLRLDMQNQALAKAQAGEVLAKAITAETVLTDNAKNVAIKLLGKLEEIIENCPTDEKTLRKSSDVLNTCSFAIHNVCSSMKNIGIVGLPRELKEAGKLGNNQWDKQLIQQINLTVQGLQAAPSAQPDNERSETTVSKQAAKMGGSPSVKQASEPIDIPADPQADQPDKAQGGQAS